MSKVLPNFICLGGFKCATSWLHDCLAEHPEVFVPDFKEVHFFDLVEGDDLWDSKRRTWFESIYVEAGDYPIRGSITPGYLTSPQACRGIRAVLPDARLLAILRNPVTRAHSHYYYVLGRHGSLDYTFDDLLDDPENDRDDILRTGRFGAYLPNYIEAFESEQLKVMLFDDIKADATAFFVEVCDYLEIDSTFRPDALESKSNAARRIQNYGVYIAKQRIAQLLTHNGLDGVRRLIKKSGLPRLVDRFNSREVDNPRLTAEQREKLVDIYRDDILQLQDLIERDLSHWLE